MDLEKRVENLEHLVNALINSINKKDFYNDADKAGIRQTNDNQNVDIADNRAGIEQNSADIEYVAIMSDIDI